MATNQHLLQAAQDMGKLLIVSVDLSGLTGKAKAEDDADTDDES